MSYLKDKAINGIIDIEGGYVKNPNDSGGETKFGITVQVARSYGYLGSMRDLPRSLAYRIYSDIYWNVLKLDLIEILSAKIAEELVDTGVNMGTGRAASFLQTCLNSFNLKGAIYPDLKVDGGIGPVTIQALTRYLNRRGVKGETVLFRALNALQGAHYIMLTQAREKDEEFVFGWYFNRVA